MGVKGLTGVARRLRKHSTDTPHPRPRSACPALRPAPLIEAWPGSKGGAKWGGPDLSPKGRGETTFDNT